MSGLNAWKTKQNSRSPMIWRTLFSHGMSSSSLQETEAKATKEAARGLHLLSKIRPDLSEKTLLLQGVA